ncbi:TniQ family protein [Methylotenera mobilis]|uniref:TniQ domain-containing protein n=1 Tax=Methylotenera mobilis (strain JLW8 / ATCC BAA-1282 / DSM 17540) TaxID=583345 RepID=C6WWT0_METML|nr:TniQ family protein [Methylotenera mobilis]ACT48379.1 hypothetical protein Mmol_1475 [Methylotenera mobilis JLW8]
MMYIPKILPDEWINGYYEHIKFLNEHWYQENIIDALQKELKLDKSKNIIETIAALIDQPIENIVWKHTLIPAIRAITDSNPSTRHGNYHLDALGTRKMVKHARFCENCIQEDIKTWRYPYLRRSHQLTGIEWCLKHQGKLQEFETTKIPDPKSLRQITNFSTTKSLLSNQHPIIRRYVDIFDGLTTNNSPISAEHASWVLSEQAIKLGLNRSPKKTGRNLSDIAIEEISGEWLFDNFPVLKNKQPQQFIPSIDGVTIFRFQNHSVHHFILGAAILFSDADEALNKLIHSQQDSKKSLRKLIKRPESFWRSDELRDLYIKHSGSCRDLTTEIGGSYDQNRVNLLKYELPPLSILSNDTIVAIGDFYDGAPLLEVLQKPNINNKQLEYIVRNAGNTFRDIFNQIKPALLKNNVLKVNKITSKNARGTDTKQDLSIKEPAQEVMMQ